MTGRSPVHKGMALTVVEATLHVGNPVHRALTSDTWTAAGTGGASGFSPSGSGSIDDIVTIPSGGSIVYTVTATINSSATGTLSSTVTMTPPPDFTNSNPLADSQGAVSATDRDNIT